MRTPAFAGVATAVGRARLCPLAFTPLALVLGALSCSSALAGQPDPAATVVVTGTRGPVQASMALAEVTVIGRAELDAAAGRSLPEVLARQPGLQAWTYGGPGTPASVSVRGLEPRHTLLLVDGVRVGSATLGTPSFENLPLEAIDRIEIVRGPLSALYGADAAGGVVQVFTRRAATGWHGQASASLGSGGQLELGAGLGIGQGGFSASVQVGHFERDGFSATNANAPWGAHDPDADGFEQDRVALQAAWRLGGDWRLQAQALRSDGEVQLDDGPGADARAALTTQSAGVQLGGTVSGSWRSQWKLAQSRDGYDTLASASPWTELGLIGTTQRQFSWENTLATPAGTLLLLAERLQQDVERPNTPFALSSRRVTGVAAGLDGRAGVHHWQLALRRDRNSQFGGQTTGSLAYGFDVTPAVRVSASFGTSFNMPSFNQLYYPGFGNPALLPEEGRHREVAVRGAHGAANWRLALFDSAIRGYITPGANPGNVDARVQGLSLSGGTTLGGWQLDASAELLDPRNDSAGHVNEGRWLPRRARELLRLSASRDLAGWTVGAALQASGARYDDAANTARLAGHALLDLHAQTRLGKRWRLGLKLNNVGDQAYETVLGYNQGGREAFVTLRYDSGR